MTNDAESSFELTPAQLNGKLNQIGQLAAALMQHASVLFCRAHPDEYAVMLRQGVEFGLTVRLVPGPQIECWGAAEDGERRIYATIPLREVPQKAN